VPDTFDWSNQVLDSLWWVTWVFLITWSLRARLMAAHALHPLGSAVRAVGRPLLHTEQNLLSWRPILTVLLMCCSPLHQSASTY